MRKGIAWIWVCLCMLRGMPSQAEDSAGMRAAARHPVVMDKPAPGFFEGALLGNGGLGVVVTTRPDAVCLHFGHNNVWDIRVTEKHRDEIGTFADVFRKVSLLPDSLPSIRHDKELSEYLSLTADNYRSPYPRPFPCGTLLLGFDRREVELLGYSLDVSVGVCHISLSVGGEGHELLVYADMEKDEAWLVLTDGQGRPARSCFNRLRVIPDPSAPGDIPRYRVWESGGDRLGFYQELPCSAAQPRPEKDKAFALQVYVGQRLEKGQRVTTSGIREDMADMERRLVPSREPFCVRVALREGTAADVRSRMERDLRPSVEEARETEGRNRDVWKRYWGCSSVSLADKELEGIWYRNLYFLQLCASSGGGLSRHLCKLELRECRDGLAWGLSFEL